LYTVRHGSRVVFQDSLSDKDLAFLFRDPRDRARFLVPATSPDTICFH